MIEIKRTNKAIIIDTTFLFTILTTIFGFAVFILVGYSRPILSNTANIGEFILSIIVLFGMVIIVFILTLPFTLIGILMFRFFNFIAAKSIIFDGEYVCIKRYVGKEIIHITKFNKIMPYNKAGYAEQWILEYTNMKGKLKKLNINNIRYDDVYSFISAMNNALGVDK